MQIHLKMRYATQNPVNTKRARKEEKQKEQDKNKKQ